MKLTVPVLPVADVEKASAFYREQLGFAVMFQEGDYIGVNRDDVWLHLDGVVNAAAGQVTARSELSGVDELYGEYEPRGVVDPNEPLNDLPWARQFSVVDVDGNRVTFVQMKP
jgi:catechol 2,3-dioxygenase-like lactoylglutathione lyase family enzyme